MDTHAVSSWSELERWATLPAWNERLPWDERLPESSDGFRFVFRGQSSGKVAHLLESRATPPRALPSSEAGRVAPP